MSFFRFFTFKEIEKRKFDKYKISRQYLESLDDLELHSKYCEYRSKLEYRKLIYSVMLVSIILSIISNIWQNTNSYFKSVISLYSSGINSLEVAKLVIAVTVFLFCMCAISLLVILFIHLKETKKIQIELLLVEDIIEKRKIV